MSVHSLSLSKGSERDSWSVDKCLRRLVMVRFRSVFVINMVYWKSKSSEHEISSRNLCTKLHPVSVTHNRRFTDVLSALTSSALCESLSARRQDVRRETTHSNNASNARSLDSTDLDIQRELPRQSSSSKCADLLLFFWAKPFVSI